MLSETRDMDAAKRFVQQARVVGHGPTNVTTDGHDAYPHAIRETLGPQVIHGSSRYKNNVMEQDHRGIKQRYYPCVASARSTLRPVSALLTTNCTTISVTATIEMKRYPWPISGACSKSDGVRRARCYRRRRPHPNEGYCGLTRTTARLRSES